MRKRRERCDHCGKFTEAGELLMPPAPIEAQDGRTAICPTCATSDKFDIAYWINWWNKRKQ